MFGAGRVPGQPTPRGGACSSLLWPLGVAVVLGSVARTPGGAAVAAASVRLRRAGRAWSLELAKPTATWHSKTHAIAICPCTSACDALLQAQTAARLAGLHSIRAGQAPHSLCLQHTTRSASSAHRSAPAAIMRRRCTLRRAALAFLVHGAAAQDPLAGFGGGDAYGAPPPKPASGSCAVAPWTRKASAARRSVHRRRVMAARGSMRGASAASGVLQAQRVWRLSCTD